MTRAILRGDVYFAALDPTVGSEQGGHRPVLIVQNNAGNRFSPTVIIAPITSRLRPELPTHLPLSSIKGLRAGSVALLEQLRTIDKQRLGRYVGTLGTVGMCVVDAALAVSLNLKRRNQPPVLMTLCHICKMQFEDSNFEVRLISSLNDAKETCDFCNHRKGFDYEVKGV
jgi:mRNA interferase MazF